MVRMTKAQDKNSLFLSRVESSRLSAVAAAATCNHDQANNGVSEWQALAPHPQN